MHHKFDIEFSPNGEWWSTDESDMTTTLSGYDNSAAKLLNDAKSGKYR